jgi:hypothetical protein
VKNRWAEQDQPVRGPGVQRELVGSIDADPQGENQDRHRQVGHAAEEAPAQDRDAGSSQEPPGGRDPGRDKDVHNQVRPASDGAARGEKHGSLRQDS